MLTIYHILKYTCLPEQRFALLSNNYSYHHYLILSLLSQLTIAMIYSYFLYLCKHQKCGSHLVNIQPAAPFLLHFLQPKGP